MLSYFRNLNTEQEKKEQLHKIKLRYDPTVPLLGVFWISTEALNRSALGCILDQHRSSQQVHSWMYSGSAQKLSTGPLLGVFWISTEALIWKDACTSVVLAAASAIAKVWKPPPCPPTEEWIKRRRVYTTEYCSGIKKSKVCHVQRQGENQR